MVMGRNGHWPKWLWAEMTRNRLNCNPCMYRRSKAFDSLCLLLYTVMPSLNKISYLILSYPGVLISQLNRIHRQTDVIIMHFAKAFDKVPHRRLLYKLDYYGIRGSTHNWITSWLSGHFQKVVLDGQASDPVPVLSGVPQGSVLGPVLFLIFINDLPENIRSSVRLFADDCALYRNIESPTDCQILQDDLNRLAQWEADWQMKFNVAKCHSMRVTRHPPDKHIQFEYTLHQQRLEQVQSAKYIGITISDDLDWGQHISEISSKATKTMGFLRRNLAFAPRHTKEVA